MHRYNCIIVEDEPLAAEVIKDYVNAGALSAIKRNLYRCFICHGPVAKRKD